MINLVCFATLSHAETQITNKKKKKKEKKKEKNILKNI